jgi:hypothetical protein
MTSVVPWITGRSGVAFAALSISHNVLASSRIESSWTSVSWTACSDIHISLLVILKDESPGKYWKRWSTMRRVLGVPDRHEQPIYNESQYILMRYLRELVHNIHCKVQHLSERRNGVRNTVMF